MASQSIIPSSSVLKEQLYRPGLTHQVERQTFMLSFADTAEDAGIVILEEFTKKRGDAIQIRFSPTEDTRDGYVVGDTIQGTEADPGVLIDSMKIDWLGEAFKVDDPMSQQRVSWDMKKTCYIKGMAWWSRRFEQWTLNQLAGYTPAMGAAQTNYKRTGLQPVIAVDSAHTFRPNGIANDQSLTANERMSLNWINELMLRATSDVFLDWPLLPCPDGYFHLVMHPICWRDLRNNTSPGDFEDLQRARLEGGQKYESSAFAQGYSGLYNRTKLHVSDFVPKGVNSTDATAAVTDVRRAVLIGAHAGTLAFGQGYNNENHLDWTERVFEYKKWGVLVDCIGGFKRTTYKEPGAADSTGITYGSMVLPVYAAA